MVKTIIHKEKIFVALLLSVVLISAILIKPAHLLFVHHEGTEISHSQLSLKIISNYHAHDCVICDFEFCSFIPQKQVIVPQVNISYLKEPANRAVTCFVCTSSHIFQLRAPPAVWISPLFITTGIIVRKANKSLLYCLFSVDWLIIFCFKSECDEPIYIPILIDFCKRNNIFPAIIFDASILSIAAVM